MRHGNKELSQLLKDSFFLKDEEIKDRNLLESYAACIQTNQFDSLSREIINLRQGIPGILITYDIDWLSPWHPYAAINVLRKWIWRHPWVSLKDLFNHSLFLDQIQKILEMGIEKNIHAVFCFGVNAVSTLKRHDFRYTIKSDLAITAIQNILQNNNQIGLQSSYEAEKQQLLAQEKMQLEHSTEKKVRFHRSHYLKYDPLHLYSELDQSEIDYDIGLGFSRMPGISNGYPGMFRPYNPETGKLFHVKVIPMILMDNAFFNHTSEFIFQELRKSLKKVIAYKGTACIAFHPENMLIKPELFNHLNEILHICNEEGVTLNPTLNQ